MFVAWRDLRFARGRFALIGAVVALITLLVGFLAGLTGGLAAQNVSAVLSLSADRLVFSAPAAGSGGELSFSDSNVTETQVAAWTATAGVTDATALGISQTRAEAGTARASIAIFATEPGFDDVTPTRDGRIGLSADAADELAVAVGDVVTIGGTDFEVEAIGGERWHSHTPVVQLTLHDWQAHSAAMGSPETFATLIVVSGTPDWGAADAAIETVSETQLGALTSIGSFRSEIGSLALMVAMLFGISALVIGAFFTVWTMQRKGDIAVLKALGASTPSLLRDALGQALVVLIVGVGVGIGVVAILAGIVGTALPFVLSPLTTLAPAAVMILLGLAGAAFALRSVTTADPLTALGSIR